MMMNDYWELKRENGVENAFMIDKSRTINLFVIKIDQGSEISSLDIINDQLFPKSFSSNLEAWRAK